MKILTSEQMQSIDRRATEEFGIPSIVLMENAALGVMDAIFAHYPDADRAAIFCGPGQNGGDGLAIARHFENRGVIPTVILLAEPGKIRGDARTNLEICRSMGLPLKIVSDDDSLGERSEEHTSELQSQSNLVCRLLLEKYADIYHSRTFPTRRPSELGQYGGDGLAIARHFENRGVIPTVILLAEPGKIRGDARTNLEICRSMGLPLKIVSDDDSLGE